MAGKQPCDDYGGDGERVAGPVGPSDAEAALEAAAEALSANDYAGAAGLYGAGFVFLPHAEAALRWIDEYGDRDGDGFVEYLRETPKGLAHQGWKDSQDAVSHADGALAEAWRKARPRDRFDRAEATLLSVVEDGAG